MDAQTIAIAEAQAAKDAELMAGLTARAELAHLTAAASDKKRRAASEPRHASHAERVRQAQNASLVAALQNIPLNREQRRAQVKAFGQMLKEVSR